MVLDETLVRRLGRVTTHPVINFIIHLGIADIGRSPHTYLLHLPQYNSQYIVFYFSQFATFLQMHEFLEYNIFIAVRL